MVLPAEIPLQPVVQRMVRPAVPLQKMEEQRSPRSPWRSRDPPAEDGEAEIPLQPVQDPTLGQADA